MSELAPLTVSCYGPLMPVEASDHIKILNIDGRTIYLLGTAHVSDKSVKEVQAVIDEVRPDTVCIELCDTRYEALTDEDRWRRLNIFDVIRQGKTLLLLANLALSAYQRRLGAKLGVDPGAELLAGAKKAEEIGAKLELIDRNIQTTLKRTWSNVGLLQKARLLSMIVGSTFSSEEIDAEAIEELKGQAQLSEMLAEFAAYMPEVKQPLIDERDRYMMSKIRESKGERVVAVVGAAHVPGMLLVQNESIDRDALDVVPPRSRWLSVLKWVIPTLIFVLFAVGWSKHEGQTLEQMLYAWVIPNAVLCGLMTAIGGGKALSVIVGFLCSPITSLNPALGAGMVVGLLEAWLRKPTVADAQRIKDDIATRGGLYRNNFTRVLLVAFMATVGSALGAWVGAAWVVWLGLGA
jgi:pheromone shutdown-related protein TraB